MDEEIHFTTITLPLSPSLSERSRTAPLSALLGSMIDRLLVCQYP
jgi:hypothetical protein